MLIGPDAPLALEPGVLATHALDIYDFYKPNHSEYGQLRTLLHIMIFSRIIPFSPIELIHKTKLKRMKRSPDALFPLCPTFLLKLFLEILYLSAFDYFYYCPIFIHNYICSYNHRHIFFQECFLSPSLLLYIYVYFNSCILQLSMINS